MTLGDDSVHQAVGFGTISIQCKVNGEWLAGKLNYVLYIPSFSRNLYSTNVQPDRVMLSHSKETMLISSILQLIRLLRKAGINRIIFVQ